MGSNWCCRQFFLGLGEVHSAHFQHETHFFFRSGQFKQRYDWDEVCRMGIEAREGGQFFGTEHGKGIVNSHRADVKGCARWELVLECKQLKTLQTCRERVVPSIKVLYIPKKRIKTNWVLLQEHFDLVSPIPRIKTPHTWLYGCTGLVQKINYAET